MVQINKFTNKEYTNILILTNTRDNLGSQVSYVEKLSDIKDIDLKTMIKNCIEGVSWEKNDLWTNNDMCGSDRGYVFNDYALSTVNLPVTVNTIVNYVF